MMSINSAPTPISCLYSPLRGWGLFYTERIQRDEKLTDSSTLSSPTQPLEKQTLPAGALIINAELPVAAVVADSQLKGICSHCFTSGLCTPSKSLLRCAQCKLVHYCSQKCQKMDWQFHAAECKRMQAIHPAIPPASARLVCRLLQLKKSRKALNKKNQQIPEPCSESIFANFEKLVSHKDQFSPESLQKYGQMAMFASAFYNADIAKQFATTSDGATEQEREREPANALTTDLNMTAVDLLDLCCRIGCNSFNIIDIECLVRGVGIYLQGSRINHSCSPNAVAVFNGASLSVCATRAIHLNEEIVISYVDPLCQKTERQADLLSRYCFQCQCPLCQLDDPLESGRAALTCGKKKCLGMVASPSMTNCTISPTSGGGGSDTAFCPLCHGTVRLPPTPVLSKQISAWDEQISDLSAEPSKGTNVNVAAFTQILECLKQQSLILHGRHALVLKTQQALVDMALSLEKFDVALTHSLDLCTKISGLLQDDAINISSASTQSESDNTSALSLTSTTSTASTLVVSPVVATHGLRAGKLLWYFGNARRAHDLLVMAATVLRTLYGADHAFLRETVMPLIAEIRMAIRCGFNEGKQEDPLASSADVLMW